MNRSLIIFFLLLSTFNLLGQAGSDPYKAAIRKGISRYYLNDSTVIADSMFTTLTYFDEKGRRLKEEERHYVKGKPDRTYTATYHGDDQLLELRENGKVMMSQTFDPHGTVVKAMSVIHQGRDTFKLEYIPKYENEVLVERKVIVTIKTPRLNDEWKSENTEYFTYQHFRDSRIITSTINYGTDRTIETKCYDARKKLLNKTSIKMSSNAVIEYTSFANRYDNQQNIIEKKEVSNGVVVSVERFNYHQGRLITSVLEKPKIMIKTSYEFVP